MTVAVRKTKLPDGTHASIARLLLMPRTALLILLFVCGYPIYPLIASCCVLWACRTIV